MSSIFMLKFNRNKSDIQGQNNSEGELTDMRYPNGMNS